MSPSFFHRGQAMLLTIFILVFLLTIIPIMSYLNRASTQHGVISQKQQKALDLAQEGVNYAFTTFSYPSAWANALTGTFPVGFTNGGIYTDPQGAKYKIQITAPSPTAYEMQVVSTALIMNQPTRALQATLSQKTLSVSLGNGAQIPVAVQLGSTPTINGVSASQGILDVHWGSIEILDPNPIHTWNVPGTMDAQRYPRKFALNGIAGTSIPRSPTNVGATSDQKEYWAFASLGFEPVIDVADYTSSATTNTTYWPSGPKTFTGAATGSPPVYVVNGDVTFNGFNADLKTGPIPGGAFIVTGNLTLTSPPWTSTIPAVRVPPTALLDYPYGLPTLIPAPYPVSCVAPTLQPTCSIPHVDFRGFLYVQGNLTVTAGNHWVIDGVLRVDGALEIDANASLTVYYDDEINHQIGVSAFSLQTDSQNEVSAQ
jgi:hypothetical protein